MIRLRSLLIETVVSDPNFIAYIKSVEGLGKGSTKERHVPYKDSVGKLTIGYGHTGNVKPGMIWTGATANQYLIDDLITAKTRALDYVNIHHPKSKLGTTQIQMLTDFAFNLGSLDEFPKFTKAVVTKDWKLAAQEYKRYAGKPPKPLTGRNDKFFKTFLQPLINATPTRSPKSTQTTPYIDVTYTSDNPPYTDLLRNPIPKLIASVLKQSLGVFNDYEAWAEAAFMAIKTKSKYEQVKKELKNLDIQLDPYEYVKSFMDTSKRYHKQPIDISYKTLT